MSDINKIASNYLAQIAAGNYSAEQVEIEPNLTMTGLVTLRRPQKPEFFYGFKPSGRPIFTHDIRLAMSFHRSMKRWTITSNA